jgi:two-component system CheB/CheR fusion protein
VRTRIAEAAASRTPFALDYRLRRADGEWRWVIDSARPRFDEGGRWLGYIGSVIDVHERKLSEQALREADQRKDEFLATLAHELRNPLAPIRNAVVLLHEAGCDTPRLRWARDVIDRQSQHLTRLLEDLLEVSRISTGRLQLRKERVELSDIVRMAMETSRPLLEHGQHQLRLTLPPAALPLCGDAARLAQVFASLLDNAARYTQPGGCIDLVVERRGAEARVSVRDDGMGIPAEMLPKIFDLFVQVDRSLERSHGGLGIGLTLARSLVEMHEGRIEARSDGPGKGSCFTVHLPVLELLADPPGDGRDAESESTPALRILVADDHRDGAESLGLLLGAEGHQVEIVHDGSSALGAARELRPDVALLDIGMPQLNGYDVAHALRAEPATQDICLIALTGWGQPEDRLRSAEAGFDHHLVKPVAWPDLLRVLGAVKPLQR